jgi:hypothetical protein
LAERPEPSPAQANHFVPSAEQAMADHKLSAASVCCQDSAKTALLAQNPPQQVMVAASRIFTSTLCLQILSQKPLKECAERKYLSDKVNISAQKPNWVTSAP